MNKIFRVIYNRATQSWVAVSELTKAHKKQSSSSAKKSASGSSANLIKSSAIALSLLSGSAAYAAAETAANGLIQINSTKGMATATGSDSIAIGKDSKASGNNNSLAIGHSAQATGNDGALAIGGDSKASGKSNIALGYQAQADKDFAVAIGKGASAQKFNNAVAIGANAQANGATSLALGMGSKATGHDSYAIGYGSDSIGEQSIAFGRTSKASKKYDIVFGSEANTRDQGQGHSIAIGYGAMSGTNSAGKNLNGGDAGGVAIGTGAYTGVNKNNISLNSSVAVGAGAGAGYREVDADGLPTKVATDADTNVKVLAKAFGGTTNTLDYFKNSGKANEEGFFSFQGVNINEATALGRNARAIGDQSVAIGAQSVAGQGSIVIGGNDIQAYDNKKYFKALNPDSRDAKGVNDFDAETTPGTGKNGNPITIRDKYKELVGAALDNSYRSSYGQDGSTVIGMQAHSTTPLGVAIGTNSIVRKGAFGATAIGSGASVLANAEAAVAIGMGSEAQGNYAVAAGTGAKAEESAVAAGYQANAGKSAVAVGDSSKAATSSVAVGQGAVSEQVSDIAIGQGAKAKGEQGAIAMGLGTIAQGHSSIMIGGSDISTAANQVVSYSREKVTKDGTPELYDGKITEVINGKTVTRTVKLVQTETVMGKKLSDAYREITGYYLNTLPLDYSSLDNKNGHASISMGIHSLSKGAMGVAIGTGARADALGSMALGTGAHAGMQNSVAIGTGAVADKVSKGTRQTDISYDEDGNVVETGSAKAKYTFRWAGGINTSEGDVVSFGTPGAERQLKNVAAGRVAEDSTDAVNGSQLNAITRSLSQTITNGWQVGGNNKFRMSNIGSNDRVNFLDGLGTAVNIAEINQAEDTKGNKLVKIGSDFYKASDFTNGVLNAGAQKVAAAEIKKQPAGANVTFDVKEVNSTLSVSPVGLKVTTGEVTANPDGTMKTPNNTTKANNATVTTAMNAAETALVASQKEWREKNDAYQQTELAYLAADTALTKGKEAVEAIQADIATTQQELQAAQSILATDKVALTRAENEVKRNPNDTQKQSELNQAKEKVGGSQFVVDQRTQKLAHQQATLTDRQNRVTVLEQEKTNAETVRNTAKDAYEVANSDLKTKKAEFDTAKKAFVAAGANQIATVQNVADSINASGWTLQQGTSDKDLVQPGDKVSFADGNGTTVTVTTNAENKRSEIKFDIDKADLTTSAGKVVAPDLKELDKAVKDAQAAVNNAKDADNAGSTETTKQNLKEAEAKLTTAQQAYNKENNKVATAQSVAAAINDAYWIAAASGNGANGTDDNVKAGTKVTFDAGKNIEIDHSTANKFTFKTVDSPVFTTVQIGNNGPKITNDGDNLKVTKADGTSPTKITNVANGSNDNDAVNVSQLKASGWKVAGNRKTEVDTINPSEQVNFLDGSGTTVTVEKDKGADGKENGNVNVKYDVKLGNGLNKDTGGNITVKADGNSITVSSNGIKVNTGKGLKIDTADGDKVAVNTDDKTVTVGTDGTVKAVTGTIETVTAANKTEKAGQVRPVAADKGKLATVDAVASAVNSAKWMAKATNTDAEITDADKTDDTTTGADIAAGDEVTFTAGKNLRVKRDGKNFTFATDKDVSFDSVKVGAEDKTANGKKPVSLITSAATTANNNQTAPTTALNISSGTGTDAKPTQITGVGSVLNATTVTSAPDGTAPTTQPKLVNLGTAHNQTALADNVLNSAATVRDLANMGWKVSADKVTGADGKSYSDVVRNADEVKFVGKNAAKVSGKTENGVRTITVDVEVPDVKTAKLVSSTDGSVIAPSTDSKLQDALKTAKDELAALPDTATEAEKEAAENKVKDAETALNKALDEKGVATAKNVADMINNSGFTLKTSATADGKKDDKSTGSEVIKPGKTVEMVAGKNLTVKQEANGKVTYSLNPELINLTSAEFKADGKPTVNISSDGIVITPNGKTSPTVSLTENGLNNGGNHVTNVKGNLPNTVNGAPGKATTKQDTPETSGENAVKTDNAATVGDILNAGWNIQEKGTAKDFVKAYDTVNFDEGNGTSVSVGVSEDGKTSTVKYSVKAADKTLTVGKDGVKVNTGAIAAANGDEDQTANRGKVTVTPKIKADGTTETQAEAETRAASEIATVKNVADAINSAAWIAKVENTEDSVDAPTENDKGTAVKAGDTLNLKAGKNLKVNRTEKDITFALAKDITVETANVENTLTIGKAGAKVNIASGANGLTLTSTETAADGSTNNNAPVYLNGIKPTLPDTLAGGTTAHIVGNIDAATYHRAASVQDVLNSGWNLKGNGSAVDFVRAYDTVNFVNGKGTTVSIETDGKESRVKVDVDTADLTASNGKISAPDLKTLEDAVKAAKADADANPADEAKKTALEKAEADLAKEQNKGVTAQNVAKAINESGFTLKTSATVAADNLTADNTLKNDGEVINPGKTVEMVAGKNLTVKQDAGGKVTYATKDDVEFATVKIGKDEDGKKPVSLTTEKAVKASNNETGKEPATALKISSDGKPAQLVGVASVLNTSEVSTKPNGDKKADGKPAESKTEKLIDLAGTKAAPVNKNAAATVGDLQNMGWVVSTKDGNGYTDVVKNADKVDFKGSNGIEVRGSTAADGTRVITVSAKEGKVTNKVEITKNDGSKVHAVIIDGKYYERDENGKPKTDTEIPAADIKAADNGGSGFVTGNTVANAINKSGWNVGLAEKAKADAAFGDSKYALDAGKPEKVNPDDNVHFANGNNTVVKAATVEEVDKDGKTVTNTYIRVDAELPISQISAVDENGNKVVKDADGNWYLSKADGTADKTQPKVDPAKVRQSASMDPENKGDRYTPLAKRSDDAALTADQKDALSKQQDQYAKDAADKIAEQLKGQPQTVIEAAQKAAAEVARVEAKDKYLKDNGLDKGIGGTVITNVAWGQKPDDAVNVDQLQNSGWNLDSKAVAGSSGKVISGNVSPSKVKMDETVNIDAGNNIEITRNGKNIGIATSMTPQFSSVSLGTGADAPTLSVDGDALNVGSKKDNKPVRITNVAPGVKEGDVTNVAQLKGVAQNLNNRIDNVDGNARAGIAQAIATAGLVQAYLPGKSMMAIGGGTYRGEAGYAIGYSSISDGGNWIIKGTASGNSRGHFGASASVGYQW